MNMEKPTSDTGSPSNAHAVRVGASIRRIRTTQGLSLRRLAEKSGLSSGFLSLAERGVSALSLTSLFDIAEALGVDAVSLLGAEDAPAEKNVVVRRQDSADTVQVAMGDREHTVLSGGLTDQKLEVLRTIIAPSDNPPEMTAHEGEEFCYVLDGELTFSFAEGDYTLRSGDSIHFTSSTHHAVYNGTDTPTTTLWVVDRPLLHHT